MGRIIRSVPETAALSSFSTTEDEDANTRLVAIVVMKMSETKKIRIWLIVAMIVYGCNSAIHDRFPENLFFKFGSSSRQFSRKGHVPAILRENSSHTIFLILYNDENENLVIQVPDLQQCYSLKSIVCFDPTVRMLSVSVISNNINFLEIK